MDSAPSSALPIAILRYDYATVELQSAMYRSLVQDRTGHNLYERDPYDKPLIIAIIIELLGKENEK